LSSYLGRELHKKLHDKDTTMKLTAIALASAFALSGTCAFANTVHHKPVHHKSVARPPRDAMDMSYAPPTYAAPTFRLRPNDGNPNGNPDGPTTLSGTGDSQFGGSTAGTSGYN
jgi:hypothetical protein